MTLSPFRFLFACFSVVVTLAIRLVAGPPVIQPLIRVNQFGYLPDAVKVAVIADPQVGPDADLEFTAGATMQVRRRGDDSVVFEGAPTAWKNGEVHQQSGDRGWWFNFTAVDETGEFYLWDVDREVGSYGFEISETVFNRVLDTAVRVFFYQRLAFAKEAALAGPDWADGPAFIHPGQDTEARSYLDPDNPETARDLRGGWMDAGDYNKYVTFATSPIHQLLSAYEENPGVFRDDTRIPESGNGIADLLDEVRFEMEWLTRMQEADGGVILKMGAINHDSSTPPSADENRRYYVPPCSSAAIAAAGMYAHAALVFREVSGWQSFAAELEARAERAWDWYFANPRSENCDDGTVKAGDADWSFFRQDEGAVVAAMYLHQVTGKETYGEYVRNHYMDVDPFAEGAYFVYHGVAADAFLHYTGSALAPSAMTASIRERVEKLGRSDDPIICWDGESDLYRAHMPDDQYHWGSNNVRSNIGNASLSLQFHGFAAANRDLQRTRAAGILDSLCGVNPMGLVYLTNMGSFGAEKSAVRIYHSWFSHGSGLEANPAPGYVPGGPNKNYGGSREGIRGNPPQKAYLDFNDGWPENSWEITEPAIYYQSAFVKLISKFARPE
ncbi:MAG: glycoside hydrolase family 9 protein [Opitutaceae bacterium]